LVGKPQTFCARSNDKENHMQITRNSLATFRGPTNWFTGSVYVDTVATPSARSRLGAANVHFAPGARTAWHTHPLGQTLYVTEGIGLCQRRGGPIERIRPGDRVYIEPGEYHWHGASPSRFMTHIAMHEADGSASPVSVSPSSDEEAAAAAAAGVISWGALVTDEEYGAAPAIEE
jgi:quercetin dioxygenase-like cupin family protein